MVGRFQKALHQRLDPAAAPTLHVLRADRNQTTFRFAPSSLPWLKYDLYVYREPNNGLGVTFGVSKSTDSQKLAEHLGYENEADMDESLPGQDSWAVKTLGLGDMKVVQECYSAVLAALEVMIHSSGGEDVQYIAFESDVDDPKRTRMYRNVLVKEIQRTLGFTGPVTEDSDESYTYFKIWKEPVDVQ